jgi:bifunctional UDP-N-acetylglucosamine pyrophosphorylase / glucosamine-1-phosphate N-acetyltransferase
VGRSAIVLAAGLGTRMKSKRHKVLHEVCGKPMILHILDELEKLRLDQVIVVVGQQREAVAAAVAGRAEIAVQEQQLGTGHAVQAALPYLNRDNETTVVLYGDAPLITAETLDRLLSRRDSSGASAVVLTANVRNPHGLGRVLLGPGQTVERIVEEKDATPEERAITLINTGIYAFDTRDLAESLNALTPDNAQGEYYLTDTLSILRERGKSVLAVQADDEDEIASVNDRAQLANVERILRARICNRWAREGVTIIDPEHTYIGLDVKIGRDTVLLPGTILEGQTVIGEDCVIGPYSRLVNARIRDRVSVEQSVILDSEVKSDTSVGPFAYIRPGSVVGEHVKIGDFVEIKNSTIGDGTKVSHLAYVGDAEVGMRVNVGCGVITVNYDGEKKHKTVIESDSFVGSNVNLIAPVRIGAGAYVTAGSTITDEVPPDGFAIARSRQVTKENYVKAWKEKKAKEADRKGSR